MKKQIERRYDQFLNDLETIVNIDSATENTQGTMQIARFFEKRFKALGMDVDITCRGAMNIPCLQACTAAREGRYDFMFLGHMDTVFPTGEAAKRPFSMRDGKAFGPGTCDMKAGLLAALYVVETLHQTGDLQDMSICVCFNGDEEIGTKNTRAWVEDMAQRCDRVFVFEACRPDFRFVLRRKGGGWFTLRTRGKASHAGADPGKGANALVELAHQILKITELNDQEKETSAQVTIAHGGEKANVIPDEACATIDIRVATIPEMERVAQFFDNYPASGTIPGVSVSIEGKIERPPMSPDKITLETWDTIARTGQDMGCDPQWISTGGCSDGNLTSALGIPTIDGMGPIGENPHSIDEYLQLDSIVPMITLAATVCKKIKDSSQP